MSFWKLRGFWSPISAFRNCNNRLAFGRWTLAGQGKTHEELTRATLWRSIAPLDSCKSGCRTGEENQTALDLRFDRDMFTPVPGAALRE